MKEEMFGVRSHVQITKSARGAPARVSQQGDKYLVHMRMRTIFEKQESKTFNFCVDVDIPKGCICFVQCVATHPQPIPAITVISQIIEGTDAAMPLILTMKNTTNERQEWHFDDVIARLHFMDAVPVTVEVLF